MSLSMSDRDHVLSVAFGVVHLDVLPGPLIE